MNFGQLELLSQLSILLLDEVIVERFLNILLEQHVLLSHTRELAATLLQLEIELAETHQLRLVLVFEALELGALDVELRRVLFETRLGRLEYELAL